MNVIFKKLINIKNPCQHPIITEEMEGFFDGITVREVTLDIHSGFYMFRDKDYDWSIHKSWIINKRLIHNDIMFLFEKEL